MPHRIHIVGAAGSGKTTLARQLASRIGAPVFDLDAVGYEKGAGAARPLHLRLADVQAIADGPAWITEGVFLWWIEPLLAAAEKIVWLDLPWPVAIWRIVLRHARLSWRGANPHAGLGNLYRFVRWQLADYYRRPAISPTAPDDDGAITRRATAEMLQPYQSKVIHLRTRRGVNALRRRFHAG
jgi:adenylate kinase family enzyme